MFTCIYDSLRKKGTILPRKKYFKPHFEASNESTAHNLPGSLEVMLFLAAFFKKINALRLDTIFLQISTNEPRQFSGFCCVRVSVLVSILENKCTPPKLKHFYSAGL